MSTLNTPKETTLEATNWGDPTGKGIMAAMDEMFDDAKPSQATETKIDTLPVIEPDVTKTTETQTTQETQTPEINVDDFTEDLKAIPDIPYFEESEETKKVEEKQDPTAFDEKAFEEETQKAIEGMDAKAGEKFKSLRNELKEAKKQVVSPEITQKLADLEMKATEAEGLRERLKDLGNESAKLKVESSDEYQEKVVKPVVDIFKRSDDLAKDYNVDPKVLKDIIREGDRKVRNELIEKHLDALSDFDRSEFYRMTQDFSKVISLRESMLENADKEIQRIQVQKIESDRAALEEQKRSIQVIQKDIWGKYKDIIPGFIEDGAETPEYKKLMSKSLSIDFSQSKARDQAYAAFTGVAFPHVMKELVTLRKKLSAYEKSDEKTVKTGPSPSSSVKATPTLPKEGGTFMDRFANADLS
jgi:hypothetical protein